MKIGIIGGGVTGIAEAIFLAGRGHQVTLYEKERTLGGLAAWFNIGGRDVERFYHFIMMCDMHYIHLLRDLGVGDKLNWVGTKTVFYHDNRLLPFSTPKDILLFNPLSPLERFRLCATLAYLTKLTKNWMPFEDRLACEWLPKWSSRKAWDVIWKPMLDMKFGVHADKMSMAWLWARLNMVSQYSEGSNAQKKEVQGEQRAWLKGSSRTFIEAAERRMAELGVTIKKGVGIDRIEIKEGRAAGIVLNGVFEPFDHVIFSASSVFLKNMLPPATAVDPYFKQIYAQKYYGVTCLVTALKQPFNPYFWTYVSDPTIPFVGIINYSSFTGWEGQPGHHVIYVPWYSETDQPPYSTPKEQVISEWLKGLKKVQPQFDESWIDEIVVGRAPHAAMMCTGRYSDSLVPLRTPLPGLTFANLSQIYPQDRGISIGIKLAKYAVKSVLENRDVPMDFSPKASAEEVRF